MNSSDLRFRTPSYACKIWRYMNYEKFESFLVDQVLYFCAIDTLKKEEPYEGSYYACPLLNEVDLLSSQNFVRQINQCGPPVAVNCWHLSENESMAMWKIYSKSKGIAIQTRVGNLKKAFDRSGYDVNIGQIFYTDVPIDHSDGWTVDKFMSCLTKQKCFEYEKELRALIWDTTRTAREPDGSIKVPIEVNSLVENVYLSPESEDPLMDNVRNLMVNHGISTTPIKSKILDSPCF